MQAEYEDTDTDEDESEFSDQDNILATLDNFQGVNIGG